MSNKNLRVYITVCIIALLFTFAGMVVCANNEDTIVTEAEELTTYVCKTTDVTETTTAFEDLPEESEVYIYAEDKPAWMWLTDEEIELIALVTMAEAEGECEEGKRLVIDTILNRVDSEHWPNTVSEVIWQPGQFSVMWNGRIDRCYVSEDICRLVREEMYMQTNMDVVYFTAGGYGAYGEPMFQVGNHYFSSYD